MTPQLFMLSQYLQLHCAKVPASRDEWDYSYGTLSIHIVDEGYEFSDDNDPEGVRYPLVSVSQLQHLMDLQEV